MEIQPKSHVILFYALLLAICSFPLFLDLGEPSIRLWDESINAISAFEMTQNKNIFVRYFDGEPDMWSIRPPLTIWAQAISMKIFGYNELAIRIPSALCALMTVLLIFHFLYTEFNMPIAGLFGSFVLITSRGFIGGHVSRTGDHDVYLILFLVASIFFLYKYVEHRRKRNVYLSLFILSCIAAALTKGIASFAFMPGILIYIVYRRKIKDILTAPGTYIAVAAFFVVIIGYYLLRNYYNPGYLEIVWKNEIRGMHLGSFEGESHQGDFFFFLKGFLIGHFTPWIFFLPLCYLLILFRNSDELNRITILLTSCIVTYFLVISTAKSKISWYAAPLLPLLSMPIGIGLYLLYHSIIHSLNVTRWYTRYLLLSVLTIALFAFPYVKTTRAVTHVSDSIMEKYGYFMKELKASKPNQKKYSIMHQGWNSHIHFYLEVFNVIDGYQIERKYSPTELRVGERVLTCQESTLGWIAEHFNYEVIDSLRGCSYIRLSAPSKHLEERQTTAAQNMNFAEISSDEIQDIMNIIRANENSFVFSSELRATDLEKLLRHGGPFTVFAPNNEAFKKLPPEIAVKMYTDMPAMTKILLYHIVPGTFTSQELRKRQEINTMLGEKLSIEESGDEITINGAKLVTSNIPGANGIVHVIDKVILPQ